MLGKKIMALLFKIYMAQFCVVVFNSEICVKYVCKIKSNILQNLCFFFQNTQIHPIVQPKKLISMTKCRTMNKMFLDGQNARNIFEDTFLSELTGLQPVTLYAIICVRMNE